MTDVNPNDNHTNDMRERVFERAIAQSLGDQASSKLGDDILAAHRDGREPKTNPNDIEGLAKDRAMQEAALSSQTRSGTILPMRAFWRSIAACAAIAVGIAIGYRLHTPSDDSSPQNTQATAATATPKNAALSPQRQDPSVNVSAGANDPATAQSRPATAPNHVATVSANPGNQIPTPFNFELEPDQRSIACVSTDKPIYRIGEPVYIRAVLLRASDNKPLPFDNGTVGQVEILGPRGEPVTDMDYVEGDGSCFGAQWTIPQGTAGGVYTARVKGRHACVSVERSFDIRAYRTPRLKPQLEFLKKGYGQGETVLASLKVVRAEGGIPADAKLTAIARVDGFEAWRGPAFLNQEGETTITFDLPSDMLAGQGSLTVVIEDGGVTESIAKTIPILLNRVEIKAYPEAGDLVAGLESGLYIEASTPWGDPADVIADVIDSKGSVVATIATEHEGRGKTTFRPVAGEQYSLRVIKPAGIDAAVQLPKVVETGVTLISKDDVYERDRAVVLDFGATNAGEYRITLSKLEEEVAALRVDMNACQTREIMLTPPAKVQGVLRATVYDATGKALAERVVFRRAPSDLRISITANRPEGYVPGESVELTVTTTDASGKPVGAVVGLTATDDATLEMVEKRKQAPRLPEMAMLEREVGELNDPSIYFSNDPRADMALDLLLGTQGWRRFAYVDAAKFIEAQGDEARRVLGYNEKWAEVSTIWNVSLHDHLDGIVLIDPASGSVDATATVTGSDLAVGGEPAPTARPESVEEENEGVQTEETKSEEQGQRPDPLAPESTLEPETLPGPHRDERLTDRVDDVDAPAEIAPQPVYDPSTKGYMGLKALNFRSISTFRIYAHAARAERKVSERIDFTETLFWATGIKTDPTTGTANISFDLSDSITTFRCMADGYTQNGALGSADITIESRQPFSIEPKMPLTISAGDKVLLPIGVVNAMRSDVSAEISASVNGEGIKLGQAQTLDLDALGRGRVLIPLTAGHANNIFGLTLSGSAGDAEDTVTRKFTVVPNGFPISSTAGGLIEAGKKHTIVIPDEVVPGTIRTSVLLYPSPLSNLEQALESLVCEPHGCFEQTSSTLYPLIMAQQYFKTSKNVDTALISKANAYIESGYKKLLGYECKNGGFEWYGRDPACEPMTAYGLMEFADMSQVYPVDQALIARTRNFLLSRRDGQGGFKLDKQLGAFGYAPQVVNDAYIVWALTQSMQRGPESNPLKLETELDALLKVALESKDPYIVALVADACYDADRREAGRKLASRLASMQSPDGALRGAATSATQSGGDSLIVETTAIAILAWLNGDESFAPQAQRAVKWIAEQCKNGRFGSTQATVLALKAILGVEALAAPQRMDGVVTLIVDGSNDESRALSKDATKALEFTSFADKLTPGEHTLEIAMKDGWQMPYSIAVTYFTTKPASSSECKIRLETSLSDSIVSEGETTEANVILTNTSNDGIPATLARIGLPGGLEPRHEQLKELVEAGTIDFYEVNGRDVILYFRDMQPREVVRLSIDVIAAIPGEYTGAASQAYLYYTDEHRTWVDPLKVTIDPR